MFNLDNTLLGPVTRPPLLSNAILFFTKLPPLPPFDSNLPHRTWQDRNLLTTRSSKWRVEGFREGEETDRSDLEVSRNRRRGEGFVTEGKGTRRRGKTTREDE